MFVTNSNLHKQQLPQIWRCGHASWYISYYRRN